MYRERYDTIYIIYNVIVIIKESNIEMFFMDTGSHSSRIRTINLLTIKRTSAKKLERVFIQLSIIN